MNDWNTSIASVQAVEADKRLDCLHRLIDCERMADEMKAKSKMIREEMRVVDKDVEKVHAEMRELRSALGNMLGFSDGSENKSATDPAIEAMRAKLMGGVER